MGAMCNGDQKAEWRIIITIRPDYCTFDTFSKQVAITYGKLKVSEM